MMRHRESVLLDRDGWIVEPCRDCPIPGYVVVRPSVAVSSFTALPKSTTSALGPLLQVVVGGVEAVLQPVRVYVAQFGEELLQLHYHIFPRTVALTQEYLREFPSRSALISGPLLFDWARARYRGTPVSPEARNAFRALREHLT